MLYCPRRRFNHIGRRCVHMKAALRGQAAGGRKLQCGPGLSKRDRACGGYFCGTGDLRFRRHECPFPPETQILVEGWAHMENTEWRPIGALPDQLTPVDGPPSILERVGLVCAPQLVSLPRAEMYWGGHWRRIMRATLETCATSPFDRRRMQSP